MAGPARPEPVRLAYGPATVGLVCGYAMQGVAGVWEATNMEKYLKEVEYYKKAQGYWGVNTSPNDFWGVTEGEPVFSIGMAEGAPRTAILCFQRNDFVMHTPGAADAGGLYRRLVQPMTFFHRSRTTWLRGWLIAATTLGPVRFQYVCLARLFQTCRLPLPETPVFTPDDGAHDRFHDYGRATVFGTSSTTTNGARIV